MEGWGEKEEGLSLRKRHIEKRGERSRFSLSVCERESKIEAK